MVIELNSFIPLATILGAAAAPTIAAIWAEGKRASDAKRAAEFATTAAAKVAEVKSTLVVTAEATDEKLEHIRILVNSQLSQAVDRLNTATAEIADLRILVKKLQTSAPTIMPKSKR